MFLHGLHVFLHQLLAFLRVSRRLEFPHLLLHFVHVLLQLGLLPEFIHLLLHFFHFLLHLGQLLVRVLALRRPGGCGHFLR
jgi:hypothetical protein